MGTLFYIMGKSASGKDTLYQKLLECRPELYTYVMYSTRPLRPGERDGETYHFVDEALLSDFERQGKLIEKRVYQTVAGPWTYATVDDGQIDLEKGDYLSLGTLESYSRIRRYFGEERLVPIYITIDDGERLLRAVKREMRANVPNYKEVCRRFLADEEDFSEEKLAEAGIRRQYRNDDLEQCLAEILKTIGGQKD